MTSNINHRADDLMTHNSKDQLITFARQMGWKGDPDRYSCVTEDGRNLSGKAALAYWIAANEAGEQAQEQKTEQAGDMFATETTATTAAAVHSVFKPAQAPDMAAAAAAIGQTLAGILANQAPQLDEEAVRQLVRDEVQKRAPVRHEFSINGQTRTIEGAQHKALPAIVAMLAAGLNIYMAGPAGSGKTTIAEQAAKALGKRFLMQGACASKYDLVGYTDANSRTVLTPFADAFQNGGLLLLDETDASNAAALLALQAALANGHAELPGHSEPVKRHPDFIVIVAANTWGNGATFDYVGRAKLDAAFLDRFAFVPIDYDEDLERIAAGNDEWTTYVQKARRAARERGKKVVISPRASIHGARLLAAGIDRMQTEQAVLWARMGESDAADLRSLMATF